MKYSFGQKGIWNKPASENSKAKKLKATILEQTPEGLLYIFTDEPMIKGANNLSYRTATIFPSDFKLQEEDRLTVKPSVLKKGLKGKLEDVVPYEDKDIKEGTDLPKVSIHCPIHSKTPCVSIKNGIMCKRCFEKKGKK